MGTSYQKGWVEVRGKKWYGFYRRTILDPETNTPKTVKMPVILGLKSAMSKFQAREKLAQEITRTSGQVTEDGVVKNGTVTFGWFARNRYLPLKEADWREETAKVKKLIITADLIVPFEDVRLERFDKYILQNQLNQLAKTHSKDRVLQIRSYMRAIFAEAVDQDYLPKDPARLVKVPANLREVDKTVLTWDQLRAALDRLLEKSLRDWLLLMLDMSNALRPGEVVALRWRSLLEEPLLLDIKETYYKGKIRPYGKTKRSTSEVPICEDLVKKLVEWREHLKTKRKDVSPAAFIFGGRFAGPLDPSNFRKRVLHKLAEELEFPKLTFQVIRRTIATLAQKLGSSKDVQGFMRHETTDTTENVYMQVLLPGVRTTLDAIHAQLSKGTEVPRAPEPPMPPNGSTRTGNSTEKRDGVDMVGAIPDNLTGQIAAATAKPVRGVVLEFAPKLPTTRRKEVLLNA
jgi:integrase